MGKAGKAAAGIGGMLLMGGLGLGALVLVGLGGTYWWASGKAHAALHTPYETHDVDFPVPFPLTDEEVEELRAEKLAAMGEAAEAADGEEAPDPLEGVDLEALAMERAVERGRHYMEGRYMCIACHGKDLAGGVMVDDGAIGTILGPNITPGGKPASYDSVADWDRAVRHGVNKDGLGTMMPIGDYELMSDRELSDIIAYARSVPASDAEVPRPTFGPIGTMLVATGKLTPEVALVEDHHAAHERMPPAEGIDPTFGKHLTQVCVGCHRSGLEGGPMPFGPPDWPHAANLTPHEQGLKGWTADDFISTMRTAKRPDGTPLKVPMSEFTAFAEEMTDDELKAMFAYLASVPAKPTATE
jgi:mono/diheme cytochrome c family protein